MKLFSIFLEFLFICWGQLGSPPKKKPAWCLNTPWYKNHPTNINRGELYIDRSFLLQKNYFSRPELGGLPWAPPPGSPTCDQKVTELSQQFTVQIDQLSTGQKDLKSDFAKLTREQWQLKSDLANAVTSDQFEEVLNTRTKRELKKVSSHIFITQCSVLIYLHVRYRFRNPSGGEGVRDFSEQDLSKKSDKKSHENSLYWSIYQYLFPFIRSISHYLSLTFSSYI